MPIWHYIWRTCTAGSHIWRNDEYRNAHPGVRRDDSVSLTSITSILALVLFGTMSVRAATVMGTGFVVTDDGLVITNHHVISKCESQIKARIEGNPQNYYLAAVVAQDPANDLAALKLQRSVGQNAAGQSPEIRPVIFRRNPPVQQGEQAIAYGFPLPGLLATSGNLTLGIVSALSGPGDNRNYLQITTPIQPGNSGGPLYDESGHVIGVVVAKLRTPRAMLATGDVPQNVNFAIATAAVRSFLTLNGIHVEEADSSTKSTAPDIAQMARKSTYLIECETPSDPSMYSTERPQPVAVNLSKLKLSDLRRPYPALSPQVFEISVSNAGTDPVSELTIAFKRTQVDAQCTQNLADYDGFKKFPVNLAPGDSVTLTGEFSAEAVSFCIIRAFGPPVGLSACSNSNVAAEVAIAACTRAIQSGEVSGTDLVNAYFVRGNRYFADENYDRAIADYTQAILRAPTLDKGYWVVFLRRGWSYAKLNDYDRAFDDCSEAVRLNPQAEEASQLCSYSSAEKRDASPGIPDHTAVTALNAENSNALRQRARLHRKNGELDQAIADYTEAIKLAPSTASFTDRGETYQAKGDYDRAVADYSQAITFQPNYALAYYDRGEAYLAKDDLDRAIVDFTDAVKIFPQYADAYNSRCWARAVTGRSLQDALADCNESLRLRPNDPNTLNSRGLVQYKLGAFQQAITDYSAAIAQNAKDAGSLYARGMAKLKRRDIDGGNADIAAASAIKPDIANVCAHYGVI